MYTVVWPINAFHCHTECDLDFGDPSQGQITEHRRAMIPSCDVSYNVCFDKSLPADIYSFQNSGH